MILITNSEQIRSIFFPSMFPLTSDLNYQSLVERS